MTKLTSSRVELVEELRSFYKDRKVFMTGGQGFKGAILFCLLEELGATVMNIGLQREDNKLFDIVSPALKGVSKEVDIRDHETVVSLVKEFSPEVMFHLAAQPIVSTGYSDPVATFSSNTLGTVHLLDSLSNISNKVSAVFVTTDKSYFNSEKEEGYVETDLLLGHDPYSASKSAAEHAIYSFKKSYFDATLGSPNEIVVSPCRAGNVIGGGDFAVDRLVPDLARALKNDTAVAIRNFNAVRPYEHVLDAVFAYVLLAAKQWKDSSLAGAYNIGPNDESIMSNGEVVSYFQENSALKVLDDSAGRVFHETHLLKLDSSKFRKTFAWEPHWASKTAILANTFDWYNKWAQGMNMTDFTIEQIRAFLHD